MGCKFISVNAINGRTVFDSEDEFKLELRSQIELYDDGNEFKEDTLDNPLLLIPDFTTKLKVNFNGNSFSLTYDEIIDFIELNRNELGDYGNVFPEEILSNILSGNNSLITIDIPTVSLSYRKVFHGFSLDGLSDDTFIQALDKEGNVFSGPVSYMKKILDNEEAFSISVMDKTIDGSRELKGYDYEKKSSDGNDISIKETDEFSSLWELENSKPKKDGKFTPEIVIAYLAYNNINVENRQSIIDEYKNGYLDDSVGDITVSQLTKDIAKFLTDFNIPEISKEVLDSMTIVEQLAEQTRRDSEVLRIKMDFRSLFRGRLIARINNDGFKFINSEAVGVMVNASRIGLRKTDTIKYIEERNSSLSKEENIKNFFYERVTEEGIINKLPYNYIFSDENIITKEQYDILLQKIDFDDFRNIDGFEGFKQAVIDSGSSEEGIRKVQLLYKKLSERLENKIINGRVDAYNKSKKIITTRIPSQGKQSTSVSELKIIDNSGSNYIYESIENFVIKGQDNDGDKLNTITVQLDSYGIPVSYDRFLVDGKFAGIDINKSANFLSDVTEARKQAMHDKAMKIPTYAEKLKVFEDERKKVLSSFVNNENQQEAKNALDTIDNAEYKFLVKLNILTKDEEANIVNNNLDNLSDIKSIKYFKETVLDKIDAKYEKALSSVEADNEIEQAKFISKLLKRKQEDYERAIKNYKAAMLNYIIDNIIEVHEKGTNAIEKEIPVDNTVTDMLANSDKFTDEGAKIMSVGRDIAGVVAGERVIAEGDTMVGVTANFIQLANTIKELAYNLDNESHYLYKGEPIDLSYFFPVFIDGEKKYQKKEIIISELEAFKQIKKIRNSDSKSLFDIRPIEDNIDGFVDMIKMRSEYNKLLEGKEDLKTLLDKVEDLSYDELTIELFKPQIWEDLSELMTGAVDNAKLLVLSKLGINNSNAKTVFSLLLYGVPITDAIGIMRQKDISKAAKNVIIQKNNQSLTSFQKQLEGIAAKTKVKVNVINNKIASHNQDIDDLKAMIYIDDYYNNSNNDLQVITIGNQKLAGLIENDLITVNNINDSQVTGNNPDDILDKQFTLAVDNSEAVVLVAKNISDIDSYKDMFDKAIALGKKVFIIVNNQDSTNDVYAVQDNEVFKLVGAKNDFVLKGNVFVYSLNKDSVIELGHSNNNDSIINKSINNIISINRGKNSLGVSLRESIDSTKVKIDTYVKDYSDHEVNYNLAENLHKFTKLTDELSTIVSVISFKNGKTNSPYDMRLYISNINNIINNLFINNSNKQIKSFDFDIVKFSTDLNYRGRMIALYQDYKNGINPLLAITQAKIPLGYLNNIGTQESVIRMADDISSQKDILFKRLFGTNLPPRNTYSQVNAAIDSMLVLNYIKSSKNDLTSINIDGEDIDLLTKQGMHTFMTKFVKLIDKVKNEEVNFNGETLNFNDNLLMKNLVPTGYPREEYGMTTEFINLSDDVIDNEKTALVKLDADKIKKFFPSFYKALFIYDKLQSGGSYNKRNISSVIDNETNVNYNESNKEFNFNDISQINLDYLVLLKPGIYNDIPKKLKSKLKVDFKSKVLRVPYTIGEDKLMVPLVKNAISQTGNEVILSDSKLTMAEIAVKAGYKLGYDVYFYSDNKLIKGSIYDYNKDTDSYYVLTDNKIYNVTANELTDNNPDMYFRKYNFGPIANFKDAEEKLTQKVTNSDKKKINNGTLRYVLLGKEIEVNTKDIYQEGQVIDTIATSNGSVYNLVYQGVKKPKDANYEFLKGIDKSDLLYTHFNKNDDNYYKRGNTNNEFAYAKWVAVKTVQSPTGDRVVHKSKLKKLNLDKHLTATNSDRSSYLYFPINEKYSVLKLSNIGDNVSVNIGKRMYVLTNRALGKTWYDVARKLNIDTRNSTKAKNNIAKLLGVNIDNLKKGNLLIKFFNYDPTNINDRNIDSYESLQDIAIVSAVPLSVAGSNNTYEAKNYIKTFNELELKHNINSKLTIIKDVDIPSLRDSFGASVINPSVSDVDDKIISQIKSDYELLRGDGSISIAEKLKKVPGYLHAIRNSEFIVIETDEVIYASDDLKNDDGSVVKSANVYKIERATQFINDIKDDGYITPISQLDILDELKIAYDNKVEDNDLLNKYRSIFISGDYELIKNEISGVYDLNKEDGSWVYKPAEGKLIGKTRKAFASKNESFVALQAAKYFNEIDGEGKNIIVYSKNNEAWYSYNYNAGTFTRLYDIPMVNTNIAYFGDSDIGLDLMVKQTSIFNDKVIDPSFIPLRRFIVDENVELIVGKGINKENVNFKYLDVLINTNSESLQKVKKADFINHEFTVDNNIIKRDDILNFSTYSINTYDDDIITMESEEDNYLYIINIDDSLRKEYDEIGENIDKGQLAVSFNQQGKIMAEDSVYVFDNIYKVHKDIFKYRGTTSNVNTELNTLRNKAITFVDIKHDVEGYGKISLRESVNLLQAIVGRSKTARDLNYSKIFNFNDFIAQLKAGALDNFIPENENKLKEAVLNYSKELKILKDKYAKKHNSESIKYTKKLIKINSSVYDNESVKVYFGNRLNTDKSDIAKNNSSDIDIQDIQSNYGVISSISKVNNEGINTIQETYGFNTVSDNKQRLSNMYDMFAKLRRSGKKVFISFGEVYNEDGTFKEIYEGITYEDIAKDIAKVMRTKQNISLVTGDDAIITFNENAAKLINSTDGNFTMSNINNSKIYTVTNSYNNSFNPYTVNLSNMMVGDYSVMQLWNNAIGLGYYSENTNLQHPTLNNSELNGKSVNEKQKFLDDILFRYYRQNSHELTDLMRKINGRNIFSRFVSKNENGDPNVFSKEQAIVNIINNYNSINFIFNRPINKTLDFDPLLNPIGLISSSTHELKEGDEVAYNTSDKLFKIRSEIKITNNNYYDDNNNFNKDVSNYGITEDDLSEYKEHILNGGYVSLVVATPIGESLDFNKSKLTKEDILNSGWESNYNLDEKSVENATVALAINIKGSVVSKTGLNKSRNMQGFLSSFDGSLVTNINSEDIVFIKTPNFGDINNITDNDFYDAFERIKPYLDNIIKNRAKVILSSGVTLNDYIKLYLENNSYSFDQEGSLYTPDESNDIIGKKVYKVTRTGQSFINNNERGKSGMPYIVSTNEADAMSFANTDNDDNLKIYTHVNFAKIVNRDSIIDKKTIDKIISVYKPSNLHETDNEFRIIAEQQSIMYIKLAVAVDLLKDDIDLPKSIDKAFDYIYGILSQDDNLASLYRSKLQGIISENGYGDNFDDNLSKISIFNMSADYNALKVYMNEVMGIDLYSLTKQVPNFESFTENFRYNKIHKGAKLYKQYITENDFDIKEANVLDLFLFSTILDPNINFDKRGNIDFGSVPHVFVENGINGIILSNGDISLFESMSLFDKDNSERKIKRPEEKVQKVNKSISSIYSKLNGKLKFTKLANCLNSTSSKNIPFTISGDNLYFYEYNGNVKELNVNSEGFMMDLDILLYNNVLDGVLSKVDLSTLDNISDVSYNSNTDLKYNISNILRSNKGLDQVNIFNTLFYKANSSDIKTVNNNIKSLTVGNIYMYNDTRAIVLKQNGNNVLLTEEGLLISEKGDVIRAIDSLASLKKVDSITNNILLPSDIFKDGDILIINEDGTKDMIHVYIDSNGEAYNDDNTYTYDYSLNTWVIHEGNISPTKLLKGSYGSIGRVFVNEGIAYDKSDFKSPVKSLVLTGNQIIKLSKDYQAINSNTIIDGDIKFVLDSKNNTFWNMKNIDDSEYDKFKFRSNIDNIVIGDTSYEAKAVSKKYIIKIVEYFEGLYPNKDIDVLSQEEISILYGKEYSDRAAFIYNDTIVYNTDKLTWDSPVHELSHMYIEDIKNTNPSLYAKLLEKAFDNEDLLNEVKSKGNFKSDIDIAEEALVLMIGYNSQGKMENLVKEKSIWNSIKDFFTKLFNGIFGTTDVKIDNVNMSLSDIVNTMSDDVLFGTRNIIDAFDNKERAILKQKITKGNPEIILNKIKSLGFIKAKPIKDIRRITNSEIKCF